MELHLSLGEINYRAIWLPGWFSRASSALRAVGEIGASLLETTPITDPVWSTRVATIESSVHYPLPNRVLSENHIRTYWWCSPARIGMATIAPDRWTARCEGASFC